MLSFLQRHLRGWGCLFLCCFTFHFILSCFLSLLEQTILLHQYIELRTQMLAYVWEPPPHVRIVTDIFQDLLTRKPLTSPCRWRNRASARISNRPSFPGGSAVENPPASAGDAGSIPGSGRSLEDGMATHSSMLAWRMSWTEEPGRLQSMGSQRVGHNCVTKTVAKGQWCLWSGLTAHCMPRPRASQPATTRNRTQTIPTSPEMLGYTKGLQGQAHKCHHLNTTQSNSPVIHFR